jgi:hypothetical protein
LPRNFLLKHVTEGKIEGRILATGRRGRKYKQLLEKLKEMRGCWKSERGVYRSNWWRTGSRRGYGPVVKQTRE